MTVYKIDSTVLPFVYIDNYSQKDIPFICATWSNSFRHSRIGSLLSVREFKRFHYELMAAVLAYPSTQVRVVRLKEDDTSLLSYAVYDVCESVLHYTYTKYEYRKNGLACNLCLGKNIKFVSMESDLKLPSFLWHLKHHPYFLFGVMQSYGYKTCLDRPKD